MIDVAVATTPFLDITFSGLDALPQPGQERYARQLHRSAGGGAITAVGAARLGLRAALAGPLGSDGEGALLRDDLEREGVTLVAPHAGPTATGCGPERPTIAGTSTTAPASRNGSAERLAVLQISVVRVLLAIASTTAIASPS